MLGSTDKRKVLLVLVATVAMLMFLVDVDFYMKKLSGAAVVQEHKRDYPENDTNIERLLKQEITNGLKYKDSNKSRFSSKNKLTDWIKPNGSFETYPTELNHSMSLRSVNNLINKQTNDSIDHSIRHKVEVTSTINSTGNATHVANINSNSIARQDLKFQGHKMRSNVTTEEPSHIRQVTKTHLFERKETKNSTYKDLSEETTQSDLHQTEHDPNSSNSSSQVLVAAESSLHIKTKDDKVVKVLLLSYQRCGSSLLGYLFGNFRDVFYVYEPLDALYSSLYGTAPGWNVPIDITYTRYGQLRYLPKWEQDAALTFLTRLLNCDIWNVPREFYIHTFWFYFHGWTTGLNNYVSCLKTKGVRDSSLMVCHKSMRYACGRRFGDSKSGHCGGQMWPDKQSLNSSTEKVAWYKRIFSGSQTTTKDVYMGCVMRLVRKVDVCIQTYLMPTCTHSKVRAIKTVRATMQEAEVLLKQDPDLKVIHLFRDPRGTARSRKVASWSWGLFGRGNVRNEALAYCKTLERDIQDRKRLEILYPNRIRTVVLEEYMRNPRNNTEAVYDFAGIETEKNVTSILTRKIKSGFLEQWMTDMIPEDMDEIQKACKDVFDLVPIWKWYSRSQYEEMFKVNRLLAVQKPEPNKKSKRTLKDNIISLWRKGHHNTGKRPRFK